MMKNSNRFASVFVLSLLISTLIIGVFQIEPTRAVSYFSDDFEDGTLNAWTSQVGTPTVLTSNPNNGTYHVRSNAGNDYTQKALATDYGLLYFRAYVCFDVLPTVNWNIASFMGIYDNDNSRHIMRAIVTQRDGVDRFGIMYYSGSLLTDYSTEIVVEADRWYCVEIYVDPDTSSGEYRIWVNGDELDDLHKTGINTASTTVDYVLLGCMYRDWSTDIDTDDCKVESSYIGEIEEEGSSETTVTINSPTAKYYTSSDITITLGSTQAVSVEYNFYNGTDWRYGTNQTYTSPDLIAFTDGCYEIYAWAINGSEVDEDTAIFGVNTANEGSVYAGSGTGSSIQDAVDSASDGYAVYLPSGTYVFDSSLPLTMVNIPTGISLFGSPCLKNSDGNVTDWQTTLTFGLSATNGTFWFEYTGASSYLTRVTGIELEGRRWAIPSSPDMTSGFKCAVGSSGEFRFDHLHINSLGGFSIQTYSNTLGAIDHCNFTNNNAFLNINTGAGWNGLTAWYALSINSNNNASWINYIGDIAGTYSERTWVVEDCYFKNWFSQLTTGNSAHVIYRYNEQDSGMVHCHQGSVGNPMGGQLIEAYYNSMYATYAGTMQKYPLQLCSGSMLVWSNTGYGFGLPNNDPTVDFLGFIQLRQYNEDSWGSQYQVWDTYIWDNTLSDGADLLDVHAPEIGDNPITENTHYFLRSPNAGEFVYTPLAYPNPLFTVENIFALDDPPAPTPTPTPTPPVPTPPPDPYNLIWYLNSTAVTVADQSGYGASTKIPDPESVASASATLAGNNTVDWGWRIYLQYDTNVTKELTGGSPSAIVSSSGEMLGYLNSSVSVGNNRMVFGYTGVRLDLYVRFNSSSWILKAKFLTDYIFSNNLLASDWTINVYLARNYTGGDTITTVYWGTIDYRTGVWDVLFDSPSQFDFMSYWMSQGNIFLFMTTPFTYLIGNVFYALLIFGFCMMSYIRSHNLGYMLLLIILLFAGSIGNFMLNDSIMAFVWLASAFGLAVLFWRVFR